MIRAKLSDLDLLGMVEETREELLAAIEPRVTAAAEVIVAEAQINLRRRQGTKATASPPGEPPEQDEGDLLLSVKVGRRRRTKYGVRQEYGSDHPSAGLHEWGGSTTRNGKKRIYPPRPYLRPAEDAMEPRVRRILDGDL